jgi:hypothetical protein
MWRTYGMFEVPNVRDLLLPRISPFQIDLSAAKTAELQRHAKKHTLPHFQVIRAKMILLAAAGLRNDEIAARLDLGRDVGSQWRQRSFRDRLAGLDEQPRPGRPGVFAQELVVKIKALACEMPAALGLPLSRLSTGDIRNYAIRSFGPRHHGGSSSFRVEPHLTPRARPPSPSAASPAPADSSAGDGRR